MKKFLPLLFLLLSLLPGVAGCKKSEVKTKIGNLQDLNAPQYVVSSEIGACAQRLAQEKLPGATHRDYYEGTDLCAALLAGNIDAIAYDRPGLDYIAALKPEIVVLPENLGTGELAVGIGKHRADLVAPINAYIAAYMKDGTYQEMYRNWLKDPDPKIQTIEPAKAPKGKIVIGIETRNPPFCYLGPNGTPIGFDVEFAQRLAAALDLRCEFKSMEYPALLAALAAKRIDIAVSQIDATPERRENMLFSDRYIDSTIAVAIRKKDYAKAKTPMERLHDPDKRIGTLYFGLQSTIYVEKNFPPEQIAYFQAAVDAYAAIQYKRIDAFFFDRKNMDFVVRQNPKLKLLDQDIERGSVVIGLPKRHTALCEEVNAFIRQIRKDGTYREMYDRWCNASRVEKMPAIPAPENPKRKFKVGIYGTNMPLSFYVEDGELVGYDVEFTKRLALYLNADLEIIDIPYPAILAAVETGKIDLLISGMNATAERAQKILFTDEYIDSAVAVMVHADFLADGERAASRRTFRQMIADHANDLRQSFQRTFIREKRWKLIVEGLKTTLIITILATLLGTILAFPVCALRRSGNRILQTLGKVYIFVMQGTPILVILMIFYYILFADTDIPAEMVAVFGFALNFSAYAGEMLRTGIDGVPKGQREAALALGFSRFDVFRLITLPQATRAILPVYRGEFINLLKSTSIVGYIAIQDLTRMSDIIRSRTYEAFFPLIATALIYFACAWVLVLGLNWLEKKLDPRRRRVGRKAVTR